MQTKVAADNAYIGAHNLIHLLHVLCNEHFLLVGQCAFVVPFGNTFVEIILVYDLQGMLCCSVGIDNCLDE